MQFPEHIIAGAEVIKTAAKEIRRTVGTRVLMIVTNNLAGTVQAESIRTGLEEEGVSVVTYTGLGSQSLANSAEEAYKLGRAGYINAVLGYGRANTLSLARLTSVLLASESGDAGQRRHPIDVDAILDEQRASNRGIPFIAVPSLPFDPYLCAPACVVVDARNRVVRHISLQNTPYIVIQDIGLLSETTPKLALLSTAGALLLAIEGLFSRSRSPVTESLHMRAIERSVSIFEHAFSEETSDAVLVESARDAALLASMGATRTGPGIGTAISAVVHARSGLGMSAAASCLVAPVVTQFARIFPDVAVELAGYLGAGGGTLDLLETRVLELLGGAELPLRLRDIGFDRRDAGDMAGNVDSMGVLASYGGAIGLSDLTEIIDPIL